MYKLNCQQIKILCTVSVLSESEPVLSESPPIELSKSNYINLSESQEENIDLSSIEANKMQLDTIQEVNSLQFDETEKKTEEDSITMLIDKHLIKVKSVEQINKLPKNNIPKKYNNQKFLSNHNIINSQGKALVEVWRSMSLNNLQNIATESGLQKSGDKTIMACRLVHHKVPFVYLGKKYVVNP